MMLAPPTSSGQPASGVTVNVQINSDGSSSVNSSQPDLEQFGRQIGQFVEQKYRDLQVRDLSPNGVIGRAIRGRV